MRDTANTMPARLIGAATITGTFWLTRRPFVNRVPYFYEFMMAAWPYLPNRLAWELQAVIEATQHATQNGVNNGISSRAPF